MKEPKAMKKTTTATFAMTIVVLARALSRIPQQPDVLVAEHHGGLHPLQLPVEPEIP